MATEFETWTEGLFADRRDKLPVIWVNQLDEYLTARQHRVLAHDLVKAALRNGAPALSAGELEQARIFNERGWFGRQAVEPFRELFERAARLVAV